MNITIIGRKCSPRESFKERAEKKLAKVERLFGSDTNAKIVASVEKKSQSVEITLTKNGLTFRAQERSENMNDALDACVESLIRQIRKNKTKLEKRIHDGNFDALIAEPEAVEEETEFEVVRTKSLALKPQSVEEAILQMNMLGHKFYMFLDVATDNIAVVYCRDDGGYGVLVPEKG